MIENIIFTTTLLIILSLTTCFIIYKKNTITMLLPWFFLTAPASAQMSMSLKNVFRIVQNKKKIEKKIVSSNNFYMLN